MNDDDEPPRTRYRSLVDTAHSNQSLATHLRTAMPQYAYRYPIPRGRGYRIVRTSRGDSWRAMTPPRLAIAGQRRLVPRHYFFAPPVRKRSRQARKAYTKNRYLGRKHTRSPIWRFLHLHSVDCTFDHTFPLAHIILYRHGTSQNAAQHPHPLFFLDGNERWSARYVMVVDLFFRKKKRRNNN